MNTLIWILLCLCCIGIGWLGRWLYGKFKLTSVEQQAVRLNQEAIKEAEAKSKELLLETRDTLLKEQKQQEREERDRRAELQRYERRLLQKEENLEKGNKPDIVFSDIEMPGMHGLDFAVNLKKICPDTRIVFVTAYDKYAVAAFKLKAHGYLLKPLTEEALKEEISYLPEKKWGGTNERLEVRCFGHFDVLFNGEPVIFTRKQTKELFAYLVDRQGAVCTSGEIAEALWEGESPEKNEMQMIRNLVSDLKKTLKDIGKEDVLIRQHRQLAIRKEMIDCDYYKMLSGDMDAVNSYRGEYMTDYSWAELTNGSLHFDFVD